MITIEQVDVESKAQVDRFVRFHYHLYGKCPQWVPPFFSDIKLMLNRRKHPFHEHSHADFFVAVRNGEVVGRVAAIENKPYNKYHDKRQAVFYLFDSVEDQSVPEALFSRVFEWAHKRGLNEVVGPKGFGPLDGYGIQVEGFEHRQMMTMMNYNYPYYPQLLENLGFENIVDFVSCIMNAEQFRLPEKVVEIARRVRERGAFSVKSFRTKKELLGWAWRIGQAYNKAFVNNWEYYPLTEREIKFVVDNILVIADQRLIKLILYKGEVVGFLFAFPDISAALQRQRGRITPWGLIDFTLELRRTKIVSLNGVGILPEYHGRGGNALLYDEMVKTVQDWGFTEAEQTQMADTAVQVRKDMINLGAKIYKRHRIFRRQL